MSEARRQGNDAPGRIVDGTRNLLELAGAGRRKAFHHVSSLAVVKALVPGLGHVVLDEDYAAISEHRHDPVMRALAEAERLVLAARQGGLDARIFRFGGVAASSRELGGGGGLDEDPVYLVLRAFIGLGLVPRS